MEKECQSSVRVVSSREERKGSDRESPFILKFNLFVFKK
jgi:hypothetical protein